MLSEDIMKLLDRSDTENARNYAMRVLLYNIIHLELTPGSSVSENELSSILNISRTPVREALIELSKSDLIEIRPQRGTYISKIDYELIDEARFMRRVLENAVIKLACKQISKDYLKLLEANLNEHRLCLENKEFQKLLELDDAFHKLIFQSVKKKRTYEIIHSQMVHFDRLRVLSLRSNDPAKILEDHENLFYAIKRKDEELSEMLMTRHLTRNHMEKSELIAHYPDFFVNN
jgi:DNA-binding GntR family transcriptional regulator